MRLSIRYFFAKIIAIVFCCGLSFTALPLAAQTANDFLTDYEKSGFKKTPRYAETIAYSKKLARASEWVFYNSFGNSPQGRELPLLIIDKNGAFTPEATRKAGKATLLIFNCIHSGESDGKDASLMLIREMVITRRLAHLLNNVTVLVIPIFNVDGHENFGPYNRLNQNGPEEMGFRATSQNLNLNRDFLKAESPEMRAFLQLYNRWLPDFAVDNHVTNGADHQYVLTYGISKNQDVPESLRQWITQKMEPFLVEKMAADKQKIMQYFAMKQRPEIRSGIFFREFSPRFSTGYGAAQNRPFLLVETHSLKDYKTRVSGNYLLLKHILDLCNLEYQNLTAIHAANDRETAENLPGNDLPLRIDVDMEADSTINLAGIDYTVEPSDLSGQGWVRYNGKPKTIPVPLFSKTTVGAAATVPYAYLIPQEWTLQLYRMKLHNIDIRYLAEPVELPVESYRFKNVSWRSRPFEGQQMANYEVEPIQETRQYPAGTAVILMNQRVNRVICHLLEPQSPDAFVAWGYWNTIFERKEYGEDYVLEELARQQLAKDPDLRKAFEAYVNSSEDIANSPFARLYFFYARTPYYENRENVYPVGKLMTEQKLPLTRD